MLKKKSLIESDAFTLIELLIVVAIIGILAAIAVPNFLEAQTRAKVARVKADMRTIATGLEEYAIDYNNYPPNDGEYNVVPVQITSPVAYLTSALLVDPFCDKERVYRSDIEDPTLARYYTYTKIVSTAEFEYILDKNLPKPPVEAVDDQRFNLGAFERYGKWRLVSNGPDRKYKIRGAPQDPFNPRPVILMGCDIPYDPTNGSVSPGNILRTQLREEGFAIRK